MGKDDFGLDEIEELRNSSVSLPSLGSMCVPAVIKGCFGREAEPVDPVTIAQQTKAHHERRMDRRLRFCLSMHPVSQVSVHCRYSSWYLSARAIYLNSTLNPWSKKSRSKAASSTPFYGVTDDLPILLALVCGFQHSLAMLAGVSF